MKSRTSKLWMIVVAMGISTYGFAQSFTEGNWTFTYDGTQHTLDISQNGQSYIKGAFSECHYDLSDGTTAVLTSKEATLSSFSKQQVNDSFGSGRRYRYSYTKDNMTLIQDFLFYDSLPYFIVQSCITQEGQTTKTNYIVPLQSNTAVSFFSHDYNNRILYVPWDNDGYSRYQANYMKGVVTSNNVTAIYNADSRNGMVIGALDHDNWKSAVMVGATDYYQVDSLRLLSGYTAYDTRDTISANVVMPHGKIEADTVKSSRFMVGIFDDWRTGMETFGEACTKIEPRRVCANGNFYGWNSWGVQQLSVSFDGVMDVIHFIVNNLKPKGFYDKKGQILISLDSWYTNLNDTQLKQFVDTCNKYNLIPGVYTCPFCDWGESGGAIQGTSYFTYKDLWLKRKGKVIEMVGAYAIDPTHPGTKIAFKYWLDKVKRLGIKYIKMDFMDHGAVEADSWYNKNVTTGIQAYNEGMKFIREQCGDDITIDLSISPIFPYQYAECRRISCDAYSSIDETNYVLNNTSFGWWLDQFYINDPDNLVLKSLYQGGTETEGDNRARLTSGIVTGMFLCSDNFSDNVAKGYPSASRERALKLLTNPEINVIPRSSTTFRPVSGAPSKANDAENFFIGETDSAYYLAVVNYFKALQPLSGTTTFERLGIDTSAVDSVKELWTNTDVNVTSEGFSYYVPARDARIYRILKKKTTTDILTVTDNQCTPVITANGDGKLAVNAQQGFVRSRLLSSAGQELCNKDFSTPQRTATFSNLQPGIYLVEVTMANQKRYVNKCVVR
jgi:alpha-galactosidase